MGDKLFATSTQRIKYGNELKAANAVIIKPNQMGTVTETLQAIESCYNAGLAYILADTLMKQKIPLLLI